MNEQQIIHEFYKEIRDTEIVNGDSWYLDYSEKLANQILEKIRLDIMDIPELDEYMGYIVVTDMKGELENVHVKVADIMKNIDEYMGIWYSRH